MSRYSFLFINSFMFIFYLLISTVNPEARSVNQGSDSQVSTVPNNKGFQEMLIGLQNSIRKRGKQSISNIFLAIFKLALLLNS